MEMVSQNTASRLWEWLETSNCL